MARYVSTTTPLAGGGVYTSDVIQSEGADNLTGLVFSDQGGTLVVQQSADGGVNWDWASAGIAVVAGTGKEFSVPVYGNALRLVYTNGATPQTAFRLRSRLSSAGYRG